MKLDPKKLEWKHCHEVLVCAIQPRPIALVSTLGENGVFNAAPFSFFNGVCTKPMMLGFNVAQTRDLADKDTIRNIKYTRDFVVNGVNEELADKMNIASEAFPPDVSEFKMAKLTPVKADVVKSPLVAESPFNFECKVVQILEFVESDNNRRSYFIIGEVVRVHIKDEYYISNLVPMTPWKAIARMGEELYCRTSDLFEMKPPTAFL